MHSKLITITLSNNGKRVHINPAHIVSVASYRDDLTEVVMTSGQRYDIRETAEEFISRI